MTDSDKSPVKSPSKFTEREQQLLCWGMQSLKSGPPEVDYDKLANFAGMTNSRSASNAWTKIKQKLNDGVVPVTPTKGGAKKKNAKDNTSDDVDGTLKKTARKRTAKNQDVDGEASPKKKGGRGKKNTGMKVKPEPEEESDDLEGSVSSIKSEKVEEEEDAEDVV